jgi:uncharacterized protein (DUF2267 family)
MIHFLCQEAFEVFINGEKGDKQMVVNLFDKHVQKALEWVSQVKERASFEYEPHALGALRVVLHQLRDNLPILKASYLSSQLPLITRGLYFEGWQPSQVPTKERKRIGFIHSVRNNLEQYIKRSFDDKEAKKTVHAVFQPLESHLDEGDLDKLYNILPARVREFIL